MTAILDEQRLTVKVAGEFACFTRPDLKVERMSYPCPTPAAARGILDSILWKPEFKWYVRRIFVLNPVTFFSIKRNELKVKQRDQPIVIDGEKNSPRTQRSSLVLRNVAYIIEASIFQDSFDPKNPPVKYAEMFRRRVRKGQCFRRPHLGVREFSCEFSEPGTDDLPIADTLPIGSLFHDMHYNSQGLITPLFAQGIVITKGVLDCENARNANGLLNETLMTSYHSRPQNSSGVKEILAFYARREDEEGLNA